ncbi:MAG: hypothetical protein A2667_01210 [Candidatus Wildermuthbacteria bacterium RIFCSPHIGHO2_01_FULL_47_27]|uniref:HAD family hydrolase n=2 Tax=Candidatus Wildermuthiibacteriota TaxID=1817923 RepID=A0A1G2RR83_9BACT|nr:MAG: hypothetical protein A2667_01210 [Candidatus Wildermuthbacteria bacterium RIFCSPHIGHO2_01_FULL_47_27]OHA67150.1 MAG: hypothetical protein A3D59_02680 [Candidatus Wildermuthbacteria bacterium RIFCSPHIGHO2_02_FULL_47_17]OHA75364.1 MAG: hypothetical protein A3A32_01480 [Candidatus Wildermuthbacteria bacterium RIFCSPLOWO2_01_FULL_48_35]OHA76197.1 MAG: hypothetical protein A3I38_02695 [Candidatus Wildermuthbacteria bacterium RIFCSPLOWO2_02_FULL_47_10]
MVLFDWNMTLINDGPVWYGAVRKVFEAYGKQAPAAEIFLQELAEHDASLVQTYALWDIQLNSEEKIRRARKIYSYGYYARINEVELSAGAAESLESLRGMGISMGIISGEIVCIFKALMDRFNLWPFFDNRIFLQVENKSEKILQLLRRDLVLPERCLYVGDAPSDIRYAKRASVTSVAYLNGCVSGNLKNLIAAAEPHYAISHFCELLPLAEKILLPGV